MQVRQIQYDNVEHEDEPSLNCEYKITWAVCLVGELQVLFLKDSVRSRIMIKPRNTTS